MAKETMTTVKEVMTDKIVTILKDATLQEAAKLMNKQKVGSIVVQKGKVFTGILTETDIVRKGIAIDGALDSLKVAEAMSFPLLMIEEDCSVLDATDLMAEKSVRHLIVTNKKGEVIGIISIRDIHKIGSLLIADRELSPKAEPLFVGPGKEIIGILTETDIVRKVIAGDLNPFTTPVEKVMIRSITVIDSWKRAAKACELMTKNRIRHLPIAEGNKIVGMVSIRDLINPLYYAHGGRFKQG